MTGETVTRQRCSSVAGGRRNDQVADWANPDELTITGCLFAPGAAGENHDGRDATTAQPTLYLPTGADVSAADRLVVRGLTYTVEGVPDDWRDPDDPSCDGVAVTLKRVTG